MKIRTIILVQLIAALPVLAAGQDITVKAEYPGVVRMGQQFSISWTVNSGSGDFTAPPLHDFHVLAGPQTSYSSSTQIINGKISRETSYSYVYYLQPKKEGKFTIEPATVSVKNKSYNSEPVEIEVIGGNATQQNVQAGTGNDQENEDVGDPGEDLFVNLTLNKRQVYLGQAILATVKIYTKVNISGINEIKFPDFEGFLRTDLDTPPLTSLRQENVNGSIYGTGIIQQFLLYPQVTGEINIDPVQISVLVQQKSSQSDPFFGDFFSNFTTVPRVIESKPLKVKVDPLPGVQPQNFSGIVGKANLSAKLDKDSVNVDDALNLIVTVSGNGNLKLANAPKVDLPSGVEVYDPEITDNLKNSVSGTSGQKSFKYLLIPRQSGDFTVPPVAYSYFDLASDRYERLTTPELHFYARKTSKPGSGVTVYG
ncbi:MAG: BatD family protein, partial [Bacteroidales bacterium]